MEGYCGSCIENILEQSKIQVRETSDTAGTITSGVPGETEPESAAAGLPRFCRPKLVHKFQSPSKQSATPFSEYRFR